MINPQWLELPMSRSNLQGPKDIRLIEVRLYMDYLYDGRAMIMKSQERPCVNCSAKLLQFLRKQRVFLSYIFTDNNSYA